MPPVQLFGRVLGIVLIAALMLSALAGCELPFPGPYEGVVTDARTGKPIAGASVKARWWCHDNPLPDMPGSFRIESTATTDQHGAFHIPKEKRRGGLVGCSFVLEVSARGYIPTWMSANEHQTRLPEETRTYPFVRSVQYRRFPPRLHVKLTPALPVLLKAMRSGKPSYMRTARGQLVDLMGMDCRYDANKWERVIRSEERCPTPAEMREALRGRGCPCKDSPPKPHASKKARRAVKDLIDAAALGDLEEVKRRIELGVDPDARNYACGTALMKAAFLCHLKVVVYLLSKGADVNARDEHCRTPLIKAASIYGCEELLSVLLSAGAEVNAADDEGTTALMAAAAFGHAPAVRVLLSHGADVAARDNNDETAWFKAAVASHDNVMRLLESHGAGQ